MLPFFEYTSVDSMFYRKHIAPRIPSRIFDVHVHIFLKEHVDMIPEESIKSFWASECAHVLSCDDAHACARELYPDTEFSFAGLPTPSPEADNEGMNDYIARMGREGKCTPFMVVRPEWNAAEIEETFLEGNFTGMKPYPGMRIEAEGRVGRVQSVGGGSSQRKFWDYTTAFLAITARLC